MGTLPTSRSGLVRPDTIPEVHESQIEVLRLLGRLEYVLTPNLIHLIYEPLGVSRSTMYRELKAMAERGLVWKQRTNLLPRKRGTTLPGERAQSQGGRPPLPQPAIWGLTPEGRAYLELKDCEPDRATLKRLKTRDRRAPKVPADTLRHDLLASWWVTEVIFTARQSRMCTGIFAQVEFISHESQRIDALVGLRLDPTGKKRPPGYIPWFDGLSIQGQQHWYWFALEVDMGTEALKILLGKAVVYRDLTKTGWYEQNLGDNVLPVLLTPTMRRAAQVAREWADGWPNNPAVGTTPEIIASAPGGALWAPYRQLIGGKERHLLPLPIDEWNQSIEAAEQPG